MDNHILEELYRLYGKELLLYLFSLCGNWEFAEDLMQETFVKAILSLSEHHENMRAWLYMVARNLCLNQMKREKRFSSMDEKELLIKNRAESQREDILEQCVTQEQYRILYRALLKLPSPKKEILELQYFGNLTLKEIGRILHLSHENVRVLKLRAKRDLKKILEEEGYEI